MQRRMHIWILLAVTLCSTVYISAQNTPPAAPPIFNPLKVALLKWYPANLTTSLAVGQQPYGVAFDGGNIWSANYGEGTVTKLRASDGKPLGTFKVGHTPWWMTFDGSNIWVPDGVSQVVKLRACDGSVAGTFTVGNGPIATAFDGANVWVTNYGGTNGTDGTVSKLRASDGKVLGTFAVGGTRWE